MAAEVKRSARPEPPEVVKSLRRAGRALGLPLGSVVLAFVVGAIILLLTGGNPLLAYQALVCGGFGLFCTGGEPSILQLSNTLVFVTPLIMAGIAVALPFRAGMFNIGAEGQLIMGAAIDRLVADPAFAAEQSRAARRTILETCSAEVVIPREIDMLAEAAR